MSGRFGCIALTALVLAAAAAGMARAQPPAVHTFPVATDMRLAGDERQMRVVMDLTHKVDLRAFTLGNPYRVVVDLPQITFAMPPRAGEGGRGLVKAYRFGLMMQGGSRIVIDVSRPVRIEKAYMLEETKEQPARMVLELVAIEREVFMRNLAMESKERQEAARSVPREAPQPPSNDPRPMVVIDPGHGGPDTGTKAPGGEHEEKNIVLEFGIMLRDALEKTGKYRVAMTRTDDTFIPLDDRVRFARNRGAQLFISIHADWLPRAEGNAQGATVYTLSDKASDATAARLAEAENRADVVGGLDLSAEPSDVADILLDLALRETKAYSHQFAKTLVGEMKSKVRLHPHPLKSAGFRVLRAPDVPSVLVELGYVSNKADLKALLSDEWRSGAVQTIVKSVDTFFAPRLAGQAGSTATGATGKGDTGKEDAGKGNTGKAQGN